jgi:hypothetical protein
VVRTLLVACLIVLPSCSLLGLNQLDRPQCTADSDCDVLNVHYRIDRDGCNLYQCAEATGSCVRRDRDDDEDTFAAAIYEGTICAGGTDCDDNDATAHPGGELTPPMTLVAGLPRSSFVAWGTDLDHTVGVGYGHEDDTVGFDVLPWANTGEPLPATVVDCAAEMDLRRGSDDVALDIGCPSAVPAFTLPPEPDPADVTPGVTCEANEDCQSGTFCGDGFERCDPATLGGDAMGCHAAATAPPCDADDASCDEPRRFCTPRATMAVQIVDLVPQHVRDDEWLAVAVANTGCQFGQLRVGWMTSSAADLPNGTPGPNVVLRAREELAPSGWGIDLVGRGSTGACTGGGREGGVPLGVASPALAVVRPEIGSAAPRRRPQGLVGWLAAPRCRGRGCVDAMDQPMQLDTNGDGTADYDDSMAVGVELLGVWHEQAPGTPGERPITWITPLGDGEPMRLPTRTSSARPPAVLAIRAARAGYVVAYPAEAGGIAARFVPAWGDPPGMVSTPPFATDLASAKRFTPPMTDLGTEALIGGEDVEGVVLATAPVDAESVAELPDEVTVFAAWLEGGHVRAAAWELDTTTGTITAGQAIDVSEDDGAGPPSIAAGCGYQCDGFSVAWPQEVGGDNVDVFLRRVGAGGAPLDSAPMNLGGGIAADVHVITSGGAVRVAFHDRASDSLSITGGICPPE